MTETSDEQLVQQVQQASDAAFAELVKRHNTKFYHLAFRYMGNQQEAEDVTQTAFLKLWENPYRYNPGKATKFTTWFYRVVINLCLDRKKQHKAWPMPEHFDATDEGHNQEEKAVVSQQQHLLKQAIETLPKRQKMALMLCFYQEVSHKQAASIMHIKVKALESLLARAKSALKKTLQPYRGDEHG